MVGQTGGEGVRTDCIATDRVTPKPRCLPNELTLWEYKMADSLEASPLIYTTYSRLHNSLPTPNSQPQRIQST